MSARFAAWLEGHVGVALALLAVAAVGLALVAIMHPA